MTLPVGAISLSQVNTELGLPSTSTISLNNTAVRSLAGVPSGTISMNNLRGKTYFAATIAAPVQNYNLRASMIAAGYPGSGGFVANVTINSGVYVWSDSTAIAAFDTGALSGGSITVTNNGNIMGKGGEGGVPNATPAAAIASVPQPVTYGFPGGAGGVAINLQHPMTLTNNSNIGGGGGGGGSGGADFSNTVTSIAGGGGGAGGGRGGMGIVPPNFPRTIPSATGGPGGAIGQPGTGAVNYSPTRAGTGGGGGGRIFPGVGGTGVSSQSSSGTNGSGSGGRGGGAGGSGGSAVFKPSPISAFSGVSGAGGSGGGAGAGVTPFGVNPGIRGGGGGGGWGAAGGSGQNNSTNLGGAGGVGGKAVALNGNTVTRPAIGNTYGAVS